MQGINIISEIATKHNIDCDLKKQDAYVYTQDKTKIKDFQREAEAYDQLKIDGNLKDELPVNIPIETSVMMREQYEFQPVAFLAGIIRSEEHTSELQSRDHLVCRLLLEKKKITTNIDK